MTGIEELRSYVHHARVYVRNLYINHVADIDAVPLYEKLRECLRQLDEIADRIERETLPRPRFEDGEPVQFGDEFVAWNGKTGTVLAIDVVDNGRLIIINASSSNNYVVGEKDSHGQFAKRPEPPDSWERIEADAKKGPCVYYGRAPFDCTDEDGGECRVLNTDDCNECMVLEIVRRCKALAGVE